MMRRRKDSFFLKQRSSRGGGGGMTMLSMLKALKKEQEAIALKVRLKPRCSGLKMTLFSLMKE